MSDVPTTATEVAMKAGTPSIREVMVARVARLIAARENGVRYVGYESTHREAAEEYVDAAMSVITPPYTPSPE